MTIIIKYIEPAFIEQYHHVDTKTKGIFRFYLLRIINFKDIKTISHQQKSLDKLFFAFIGIHGDH